MTDLTKLEVGKTYVFKDEQSRQSYTNTHHNNVDLISKYYKDGFTIESIDEDGDGTAIGSIARVIVRKEMKFFKLKEENIVTNKFDKSMLKDGMVVMFRDQSHQLSKGRHLVLADTLTNGSGSIYLDSLSDTLHNSDDSFDVMEVYTVIECLSLNINEWELSLLWKREEKSPTQLKIEEMESSVAELQKQINELKQM